MKTESVVKEYVRGLSDDDLQYLHTRLKQRLGGDLAEAGDFMDKNPEMVQFFSNSDGSMDWFDRLDLVENAINKEMEKRENK